VLWLACEVHFDKSIEKVHLGKRSLSHEISDAFSRRSIQPFCRDFDSLIEDELSFLVKDG
jgi:hypothetical protein